MKNKVIFYYLILLICFLIIDSLGMTLEFLSTLNVWVLIAGLLMCGVESISFLGSIFILIYSIVKKVETRFLVLPIVYVLGFIGVYAVAFMRKIFEVVESDITKHDDPLMYFVGIFFHLFIIGLSIYMLQSLKFIKFKFN